KIALAWLLNKEEITSPIIGAQKESHLESAVGALDIKLTAAEITYLEELYIPHPVVGALPTTK
ncbi:aldo/keto reductase, partial [Listeria booriae]